MARESNVIKFVSTIQTISNLKLDCHPKKCILRNHTCMKAIALYYIVCSVNILVLSQVATTCILRATVQLMETQRVS